MGTEPDQRLLEIYRTALTEPGAVEQADVDHVVDATVDVDDTPDSVAMGSLVAVAIYRPGLLVPHGEALLSVIEGHDTHITDDYDHCHVCGAEVPDKAFCIECGAERGREERLLARYYAIALGYVLPVDDSLRERYASALAAAEERSGYLTGLLRTALRSPETVADVLGAVGADDVVESPRGLLLYRVASHVDPQFRSTLEWELTANTVDATTGRWERAIDRAGDDPELTESIVEWFVSEKSSETANHATVISAGINTWNTTELPVLLNLGESHDPRTQRLAAEGVADIVERMNTEVGFLFPVFRDQVEAGGHGRSGYVRALGEALAADPDAGEDVAPLLLDVVRSAVDQSVAGEALQALAELSEVAPEQVVEGVSVFLDEYGDTSDPNADAFEACLRALVNTSLEDHGFGVFEEAGVLSNWSSTATEPVTGIDDGSRIYEPSEGF